MAVTSKDVARLAGVSQPTVSRAMRGSPSVSKETRQRIEEAARQLGYVPLQAGRALSTRATTRVGVVSADLHNPFYPALIEPLREQLAEHGFSMILIQDADEHSRSNEPLFDGSVDGVILTTSPVGSEIPAELIRRGIPFVQLIRYVPGVQSDVVTTNDARGATELASLLCDVGHQRIGAIFGPQSTSTGQEASLAFREECSRRGVPLSDDCVRYGAFTFDAGSEHMKSLMQLPDPPTAIFCANDVVALGAMDSAQRLGLSIPDDVSIVGFDNIPMAGWKTIDLTTYNVNLAEMAQTAADLLVKRIAEPGGDFQRHVIEGNVVLRSSHTGPKSTASKRT